MASNNLTRQENGTSFDKDLLLLVGGAALLVIGAGIILSNPEVKKYMGHLGVEDITRNILPDFDRYMKLRSM
jgi:hypothetical protein